MLIEGNTVGEQLGVAMAVDKIIVNCQLSIVNCLSKTQSVLLKLVADG